jgi:hypothetical protein
MRPRLCSIALVILCPSIVGCDQIARTFNTDGSSGAIEACERVLLPKLKAPSTYKRVEAQFFERAPFSYDEYQRYQLTQFCGVDDSVGPCTDANELMVTMGAKELGDKRGIGKPTKAQVKAMRKLYWEQAYKAYSSRTEETKRPATVIIKYDAANAFGTPLRQTEVCNFGPRIGKRFTPSDLYIDAPVDVE